MFSRKASLGRLLLAHAYDARPAHRIMGIPRPPTTSDRQTAAATKSCAPPWQLLISHCLLLLSSQSLVTNGRHGH